MRNLTWPFPLGLILALGIGCGGGGNGTQSNAATGSAVSEPNFRVVATAGSVRIDGFSADGHTGKLTPESGSPFFLTFSAQRLQISADNTLMFVNGQNPSA